MRERRTLLTQGVAVVPHRTGVRIAFGWISPSPTARPGVPPSRSG
ncbi:Uncharacterised protein [Mycobacteroides abscessus subsp. abscessus]|nr:Uncharacterised protein [Mycobacteroides abscessus subsp. abscessus]